MKRIKDELQYIICGDEQTGFGSQLKKTQVFLRGYAETSHSIEKQQRFKDKETKALLTFARNEDLFYSHSILERDFLRRRSRAKDLQTG